MKCYFRVLMSRLLKWLKRGDELEIDRLRI